MNHLPLFLFVNSSVENCGVHQYGLSVFSCLKLSAKFRFEYLKIKNFDEMDAHIGLNQVDGIIINYHPQTMPYISPNLTRRYPIPCIGLMHEVNQQESDHMPRKFFQYYIMGDPTLIKNTSYFFNTGRIIQPYENTKPLPSIPTIGSMGFSVGSKGFVKLIDEVQNEFDNAIIRLNIPSNGIIDKDGHLAQKQINMCRDRVRKKGIKLVATHEFLDANQLIDFLASNSINCFLYDYIARGGISSSTDHGMMARRPIAVSKSIMFRHLHNLNPKITIEDSSLRDIISNGVEPYSHLLSLWSPQNISREYDIILEFVLLDFNSAGYKPFGLPDFGIVNTINKSIDNTMTNTIKIFHSIKHRVKKYFIAPAIRASKWTKIKFLLSTGIKKPRKHFNRILDDEARFEYAPCISILEKCVPEILYKKIARANIQQAFVFDTVEHFYQKFVNPKLLCIGSFEDSAFHALIKCGYTIEEIDPAVNELDLNKFYNLPSTVKQSYHVIFTTSVIEHVRDDKTFLKQISDLLAPGGVAVLTCDFKDGYQVGDPVISSDYRFYTKDDLFQKVSECCMDCELVDVPDWNCKFPDFELGGFNYTFASVVFRKKQKDSQGIDWKNMSLEGRRIFFERNGYLVLPEVLSTEDVSAALTQLKVANLKGTTEDIWSVQVARSLAVNSKIISTLREIYGYKIKFFKAAYVQTPPDNPEHIKRQRKAWHVDYGIGEKDGDYRNSSASWVNIGIYLTKLTDDHSPFWVVPGSNLFTQFDPQSKSDSFSDIAKKILVEPGDAILFASRTVHAASYNLSKTTRHAFFYSYRPAWAKPVGNVKEWPVDFVNSYIPSDRELFTDLNIGIK